MYLLNMIVVDRIGGANDEKSGSGTPIVLS